MRSFRRDRRGFVLVFALLVMPVFIGYAFIIIDIGRGNNAHADLAAAADAVALAGARELDGGADAIARAKAAMANLTNTVSMLGSSGPDMEITLTYVDTPGNEFGVTFLTQIPTYDTTPIDAAWLTTYGTTSSALASYVYVRAQSRNLGSVFFNPSSFLSVSVPVAATAVAKSTSAVCDVPPLYICNPFEFDDSTPPVYVGDQLQTNFARGDLHGRIIKLHPKGNQTHAPGNFSFLSVNGSSSADAIRDIFAGNTNPTCYDSGTVQTKPGGADSIRQGLNTRFDVYEGPFTNWNMNAPNSFPIAPAVNVRKGIKPDASVAGGSGNVTIDDCVIQGNSGTPGDDHVQNANGVWNANGIDDNTYGLPDNTAMSTPNQGVAGAFIGTGDWPLNTYLTENYGAAAPPISAIPNSFPNNISTVGASIPSRYDVYRYEISSGLYAVRAPGEMLGGNPSGESGASLCGPSKAQAINPVADPDRRIMVAAIIDCGTAGSGGGVNEYPVNSYASIFLTRPMDSVSPGVDATIDVEIVDITGFGGNGTLETFIREEAILVR